MKKRFNITGTCFPEEHFMVDLSAKMKQVMALIEEGAYFLINRPRQYGKTTLLEALEKTLLDHPQYLPIRISFEDVGQAMFAEEALLCKTLLNEISYQLTDISPMSVDFLKKRIEETVTLERLSKLFTELMRQNEQKWVLLIDKADKSSNTALFLEFLGLLRSKYLRRNRYPTFHNVILVGVHDIKQLKNRIRPEASSLQFGSPWNIATSFNVDLSFSPADIQTMLADYVQETGVAMDQMAIARQIYAQTSGYPFLVSHICKTIAEDFLPKRTQQIWTKQDVDQAVQVLLKTSNTNFESLIHKLETHPKLYRLLFDLLVTQKEYSFNKNNPIIKLGLLYGIFASDQHKLGIHNQIYQQIIYNYLISRTETKTDFKATDYNISPQFYLPTGGLDIKAILRRFQLFMKEQYNVKQDQVFLETNGRLLFMAFLLPIINGKGYMFREPQVSAEKRLDLVITYNQFQYIIELKRWREAKQHEEGLKQLAAYLDTKNEREGYLLIFDFRVKKRVQKEAEQVYANKQLFVAWV